MTGRDVRAHGTPCVVMRGGTSRGFFFHRRDLPHDPAIRDRMFVDAIAGHDLRQADGLGSTDMVLNKVAIVRPANRPDVDIDCAFGVVTPGSARVKYGSNCGNLVSAAALFAVTELRDICASDTVRILNPETGSRVDARFMGEAEIARKAPGLVATGMAMSGAPVDLAFIDPAGTIGRGLLPTGRAVDRLRLASGADVAVSIVDSGTLYVFVRAADIGLDHAMVEMTVDRRRMVLETAETLRGQAAVLCGLVERAEDARRLSPAVPKIALLSSPAEVPPEAVSPNAAGREVSLFGRIVSSQNLHNSYAVTGAMATIAAAVVPGSVVNDILGRAAGKSPLTLDIGHASGALEIRQDWRAATDGVRIDRTNVIRTTRPLMGGRLYPQDNAYAPLAGLRTTRMWTSAPSRTTASEPRRSVTRATAS